MEKKFYLNVFNELFQRPLINVWNLEIRENQSLNRKMITLFQGSCNILNVTRFITFKNGYQLLQIMAYTPNYVIVAIKKLQSNLFSKF